MAFKAYTVKQGDNLTNIANKFDVSISEIKNYNNIPNADYIYVGDVLKIPSADSHTTNYIVQYGDTLNSIAYKNLGHQ